MSDDHILEAPGFRGRITGSIAGLPVIQAEVSGDIPAHVAESDEFAVVISGRFELMLDGATRNCGPGDHLVVAAGTEHGIRVIESGRLIIIGMI